ncbi:MAG: hypothetical protein HYX41_04725, partial [Bdellovibrio sp.]|nr:hypothetical protein [Bdellovibrio sp.]
MNPPASENTLPLRQSPTHSHGKKIAILANGRAGNGRGIAQTFLARSHLWGRKCEYFFPKNLQQLRSICTDLNPDVFEALVVVGGDGTINHVIRSLMDLKRPVPLYPFPGGTANDLARELGIQPDWIQAQRLIDQNKVEPIDIVEINGIPFATVAGIGIGASLATGFNEKRQSSWLINKLSELMRSQVYSFLGAQLVLFRRNYIHRLRIESPEFDETLRTPAVFLCNQSYLAGNLKVAPTIDNNDRRFNVLIVNTCSKTRLLKAMMDVKKG